MADLTGVNDTRGHIDSPGPDEEPDSPGRPPVRCLLGIDPRRSHGVRRAVGDMPDGWGVTEVVDGLQAVRLGATGCFDVLVLDLHLPVIDGYSAAARLLAAVDAGPARPAVVLVADAVDELPTSLALAHARMRVVFRDSPEELVRSALQWAVDTRRQEPAAPAGPPDAVADLGPIPSGVGNHRRTSLLSTRERQVLVSLCRGHSNRQLASMLSVSEATVKTHISHLLTKLGLASRLEAVVFAYENGLVVPGDRRHAS